MAKENELVLSLSGIFFCHLNFFCVSHQCVLPLNLMAYVILTTENNESFVNAQSSKLKYENFISSNSKS